MFVLKTSDKHATTTNVSFICCAGNITLVAVAR